MVKDKSFEKNKYRNRKKPSKSSSVLIKPPSTGLLFRTGRKDKRRATD